MFSLNLYYTYSMNIPNTLLRDLHLLWQNPRNYIYSLLFTPDDPVVLLPYNPKSEEIARKVTKEITTQLKEVTVEFVGSAALKLPGDKDIDLYIPTTLENIKKIEKVLTTLFGAPAKNRKTFSEWNFQRDDFNIELMLINRTDSAYIDQKIVYVMLNKDKKTREEYKQIKLSSQGISMREYQKRRMSFYNNLVEEYKRSAVVEKNNLIFS